MFIFCSFIFICVTFLDKKFFNTFFVAFFFVVFFLEKNIVIMPKYGFIVLPFLIKVSLKYEVL